MFAFWILTSLAALAAPLPDGVRAGRSGAVVVFLSAKCPCSLSHEAALKELAAKHPEFAFVGVHSNSDETDAPSRAHFRSADLGFPVVEDPGAKLADAYRALKTPHAFVVDPKGEVVFRGGVDDSRHAEKASRHFLADALDAVRAGRKPETDEARALGCYIKR